eukprot:PhF_6_TR5636/c0_g1_i5/m.8216
MKPLCKYDPNCYRQSEDHRRQYRHTNTNTTEATTTKPEKQHSPPTHPAKRSKTDSDDDCIIVEPKKVKVPSVPSSPQKQQQAIELPNNKQHVPPLSPLKKSPTPIFQSSPESGELPPLSTEESATLGVFAPYRMPFDFESYQKIISFCKTRNPTDPLGVFPGWRLTGPFELMMGYPQPTNSLLHHRYPYDPPETTTVAIRVGIPQQWGDKDALKLADHMVVHRDDPMSLPTCVALGWGKEYEFKIIGESVAEALYYVIAKSASAADAAEFQKHLGVRAGSTPDKIAEAATAKRKKFVIAPTLN